MVVKDVRESGVEHRAAASLLVLLIDGWQGRGVKWHHWRDQREVGESVLWEVAVSFSQAVSVPQLLLASALYPVE